MDILTDHDLIALDTCLWIYHLEDHPIYRKWTKQILQAVNSGQCCGVTSEMSLLEILVQPLSLGLEKVVDDYTHKLDNFPNMTLYPVNRDVTLQAATLRAKYKLRTPDALILATAIVQGASLMLTNDVQWKQVSEISVICLSDLSKDELV
ncbi:MAG: type II toxin-antitoxin system VapC family toxin [Gammaproteobacteria bacterium]|nr:MAG: type II toxin-antitoxin system VapC family toxin [Gammaproteobacteria bacterium]RKZ42150.1 MAG: type II toxin-antitoxin system VapC family toxin [Gammaproteobacteria bacterium]RKZ76079.1 MAG: type II toxin-antitoxin system VapC family toxin [Gammaproteobacteria bacterium]